MGRKRKKRQKMKGKIKRGKREIKRKERIYSALDQSYLFLGFFSDMFIFLFLVTFTQK